jgi:hypothetical protein
MDDDQILTPAARAAADRHDQKFTTTTAREAADRDELGTWVAEFLASPGSDNALLAERLADGDPVWIGPVRLPISDLNRLAGPAGEPVLEVVEEDEWRDDVEEMKEKIDDGWEPAPMVVSYRDDQFVLEDGNHRTESLRQAGEDEAWAVVRFDDEEQRDRFVAANQDLLAT